MSPLRAIPVYNGGMKVLKTKKELAKATVLENLQNGLITNRVAAAQLHKSVRHIKRMKRRYAVEGSDCVVHGNSGRHPANYTGESLRKRIVDLQQDETKVYHTVNFKYFSELLAEYEHIDIGYHALRTIMKAEGIKSPRKHRETGGRHLNREPKALKGELVQTDASPFDWLGIGARIALHGYQDDADGTILGLYFCENECLQGYLEAFRPVLLDYGVPAALYADHIGIYFVNTKNPENWSIEEQLQGKCLDKTQFGYIADELGCELIPAGSPQAKGRIERLWQTLQGRLPAWLSLHNVKTIPEANAILPQFIAEFNTNPDLVRQPKIKDKTAFVKLPPDYDLDTLLSVKNVRTTDNCGTISFMNFAFQIETPKPLVRKEVLFIFSEKIGFKACYNKKYYPVKFLGFKGRKQISHLPEVTKRLMYECFYKSVKPEAHL
jgi:transposase